MSFQFTDCLGNGNKKGSTNEAFFIVGMQTTSIHQY
jgi:hypothetical protein